MTDKIEKLGAEIFYDNRGGSYWWKLNQDRYLSLSSGDVKNHLKRKGMHTDLKDDFGLSDGDRVLSTAQIERHVDYAGPLAGHKAGFFEAPGGVRVLVTQSCRPAQPGKATKCPRWEKFLGELIGHTAPQLEIFLGWMKSAHASLCECDFRPGQFLVLAGPPNCGKSFLQHLITQVLGGRHAKPYRYMTGNTQFNYDLAGAEHLIIADDVASFDIRTRRAFGEQIKDFVVNAEMSIHQKGRDAKTLPTFRRMTASVNDQPESLMILPPLNESLMDKITLLLCEPAALAEDRKENHAAFMAELSAFVAFLKRWTLPKNLREKRCGVVAYHHPNLLEILNEASPEHRLDALILQAIEFKEPVAEWRGTAEQLESELRGSRFAFAADKIFNFSSAAGTYLSRLRLKSPERYESRKVRGQTLWIIKPETNGAPHPAL
jgi:energy-coupling factor transporter ATP-binding protein EcfA2